jgi:hypothetical protein
LIVGLCDDGGFDEVAIQLHHQIHVAEMCIRASRALGFILAGMPD